MSTDGRRRHGESEFRTRSKLHRCSCRPDQNAWHLVDFWHTSRPYHKPTIHSVNTEYNYFAYYSDIVFWNHSCTPHINSQVPELYTSQQRWRAVRGRTCEQQIAGRISATALRNATLGKLFTHVPLSPSSIIWYWPMGGDARKLGT